MFLATLDTGNFRFAALGSTEEEARGIIGTAWEHHAEQSGAFLTWDQLADDVNVETIRLGEANRDGAPLVAADTWSSVSRQTFIDTGAYLPAAEPHPFDLPDPDADARSTLRFVAADCLYDTSMTAPAPGWTWCVIDQDDPDEVAVVVCESREVAEAVADSLNATRAL